MDPVQSFHIVYVYNMINVICLMLYLNSRVMEEVSSVLDKLVYNEDKEKFLISRTLKNRIEDDIGICRTCKEAAR